MARPKKTSEPVKAVEPVKATRKPREKKVKEQQADQAIVVETTQQSKRHIVSVSSWLNVRSGADIKYPVIGKLFNDDVVDIIEEQNGWGRIDAYGWVCMKYLK